MSPNRRTIQPKGNRLYKREKLCCPTAIDRLFLSGRKEVILRKNSADDVVTEIKSALVFPLKMVWTRRFPATRGGADIQFVISIPKKRIRSAVERVTMRRRVREAFRLKRDVSVVREPLDVAFIWVANEPVDSSRIHRSIERLLEKLPSIEKSAEE